MSLEILGKLAQQLNLEDVASVVLDDERFPLWSGSAKLEHHHYGKGGLLKHTTEVVELCLLNNSYFPPEKQVEEGQLYLAALFHDAGKMWDYIPKDNLYKEWKTSPHKDLIHHISRSVLMWNETFHKFLPYASEFYADDITHAILAHHGLRQWGSPVEPQTRLAWILHLSDQMSARIDGVYYVKN